MLPTRYKFGNFEFDPNRLALYHSGELLKVEKKALEVLAVLITTPNELVSTHEIIDRVWHDNRIGVTATHLAQSISKLRRTLASVEPDSVFVETVKGRGFVFHAQLESLARETEPQLADGLNIALEPTAPAKSGKSRLISNWVLAAGLGLIIVVGLASVVALKLFSTEDELEIRRVVEESQKYESLVIYRNPDNLDESKIKEYWLGEQEFGAEVDIRRIRAGIDRLKRDGKRYGPETKNEQFEFQFVEINKDRDFATVKTLERWFISEYQTDGTLIRNKTVGPYFVNYILRKVDGKWKIERSSTARATPPAPVLARVDVITQGSGGNEFFVRLTGHNIVPESVVVKVIGPGCSEQNPCTVPNSALRQHSEITEATLSNVPLTLSSGKFKLYLQNGDSPASNLIEVAVP